MLRRNDTTLAGRREPHRLWLLASVGTFIAGTLLADAHADLPDDIAIGSRVEVEIDLREDRLEAYEVEVALGRTGSDSVKGTIEAIDARARALWIGPVAVAVHAAQIDGERGEVLSFDGLAPGQRAKAEGRYSDGVLHADVVRLKRTAASKAQKLDLKGAISSVDSGRNTFELLGQTIHVAPDAKIEMD